MLVLMGDFELKMQGVAVGGFWGLDGHLVHSLGSQAVSQALTSAESASDARGVPLLSHVHCVCPAHLVLS